MLFLHGQFSNELNSLIQMKKNITNTIILSTDPYLKSIFESRTDWMRIQLIILRYQSTAQPTILSSGLSSVISEISPNTDAGEIIPDKNVAITLPCMVSGKKQSQTGFCFQTYSQKLHAQCVIYGQGLEHSYLVGLSNDGVICVLRLFPSVGLKSKPHRGSLSSTAFSSS